VLIVVPGFAMTSGCAAHQLGPDAGESPAKGRETHGRRKLNLQLSGPDADVPREGRETHRETEGTESAGGCYED